jgi:DNA-binding NtrC family response regulator
MTVLAIDDDPTQLELLRVYCESLEYPEIRYLAAEDAEGGLAELRRSIVDLVVTDLRMPGGSGLEVLKSVRSVNPGLPVVVMTAYDDAREAVGLLKEGADDYLVKPIRLEDFLSLLVRINERSTLISEAFLARPGAPAATGSADGIVYRSASMARLMSLAARCADSHATVLVSGESGTGKELIARFIHDRGHRKEGPFVAVNISALPESLAESELFGHRRGAFTGADSDRIGRFEEADRGTLFLDEIGDITAALQVKLLRAIQFGVIERVGENLQRRLDVRIIAATNHDLAELVSTGRFRRDLFYRINVIEINVPPLRERKEDVEVLADFFIRGFGERYGRPVRSMSREAFDRLMKHNFPGNVRELENIIEHAVVLCRGEVILAGDLPDFGGPGLEGGEPALPEGPYDETMFRFEKAILDQALAKAGGNKSRAARLLGISERHLRSRLQRLDPRRAGS